MADETIILKVGVEGTGEGETKIKSLKQQLKDMKNELLGLDEGSDRFKKLSAEAGALTDKIGDVSQKVKALSSDTKGLDALVGAGSAITGAFQGAQGAMALFGANSKETEKAIQNIIAAQGILNGVQQVGTYLTTKGIVQDQIAAAWKTTLATRTAIVTAAQRVWNLVIAANPLMLLVTAVTAVVGAFALFSKGANASAAGQKALNAAIIEGDKAAAKEEATLKILITTITSNTASLRDKKEAIKELNKISPEYLGNITAENIGTQESIDAINQYIASIRTKIELQALEAQLQETISERLSLTRKLQNDELELTDFKRLESIKAEENAILQMIQTRQQNNAEIETETNLKGGKKKVDETRHVEQEIADTKVEIAELTAEELAEIERLRLEKEVQQNIEDAQAYQDFLQRNLDADKAFNEEQLRLEQEQSDAEFAILEAQIDQENLLKEQQAQADKERQAKNFQTAQNFANAAKSLTQSIFTLTNNLGKQDEASQLARAKRQFQIKKALDMAEAAIDGTKAVLSTFANTPGGLAIKTLAASAAGVIAGLKVAAIGSAKFEGGSADTSISSSPNIGSASESVGNTQPQVSPINAGSTFLNAEPQKVYVVESDITKTQKKVGVIEAAATYG